MPNQLQWTILDIEEEEWATVVAAAGADRVPSATQHGGIPAEIAATNGGVTLSSAACNRNWRQRRVLLGLATLTAVLVIAAIVIWRRAEHGLVHIKEDIAVTVLAETLHQSLPAQSAQAVVETIELCDGKAVAQVMMTKTLASGELFVARETRFFAPTPRGWRRTGPVEAYWGEPQTLDTQHLHFAFRRLDRSAVEQLAPAAEALYIALQNATGQTLLLAHGRLEIRVVPDRELGTGRYAEGAVWLPSPILSALPPLEIGDELLAELLRKTLADQMLSQALQTVPPMPQWQPLVDGFRLYLEYSNDLPLAPNSTALPYWVQTGADGSLHLADMLAPASSGAQPEPWATYNRQRLAATANNLISFLVAIDGSPVLTPLLRGFGQHSSWETLIPSVLGKDANVLDAAWHEALATGR